MCLYYGVQDQREPTVLCCFHILYRDSPPKRGITHPRDKVDTDRTAPRVKRQAREADRGRHQNLGYSRFIFTHGTDYLSFFAPWLDPLSKDLKYSGVIIVSRRSLDRPTSESHKYWMGCPEQLRLARRT